MSKVKQNPFEELFRKLGQEIAQQTKELAIGTVSSVTSGGITISIDGDTQGTKKYTCNRAERFKSGDRVLVGRESGTWVVICRIGSPGGPAAKTSAMTQAVGVDDNGGLWTEPTQGGGGEVYTLPTASTTEKGGIKTSATYVSSTHTVKVAADSNGVLYAEKPSAYTLPAASTSALGGIKTSAAYNANTHTVKVAVTSAGVLYAEAPSAYTLPTASMSTKGGVKVSASYSVTTHTKKIAIDSSGVLYAEKDDEYTLPTASSTTLGGVKPTAKTSAMTQDVGVDSSGKLYTVPGSGAYTLPTASTATLGGVKTSAAYSANTHTVDIAIDSSGKLHAAKAADSYVTELSTSASSDTYNVKLNSNRQLVPSSNSSGTYFSLGSSAYPWGDAYIGYYGTVMIGNSSTTYAKLGFFGHTANAKQTLSTTSQNMGYTSATASNYLTILNNVVGILKEKYGLIG